MRKLLIIDDEENMRHMLQAMLSSSGYEITTAENGEQASGLVQEQEFDFILCDVRMPGIDGLTFLQNNTQLLANTAVIMMSAYGSVDLAIEAMKCGAYDFISKPFKRDEVILTLRKAEEREQLRQENVTLKRELGIRPRGFSSVIGKSKALSSAVALAEKVAPYDTTVLITGESGTGKELFAKGIHESSGRAAKPFLAINCGSIPLNLLESELFGYVKGAFTGADKTKKGLFEEADGSTLFLDEIGELPLEMQVKLLRVLQENEIRKIGSSKTVSVNVRVLAATAKDLSEEVRSQQFRQDLFYRLNVLSVVLPALRERTEDIPLLCEFFLRHFCEKFGKQVDGIEGEAMSLMLDYSWPGNVRELENVIQRGVVLAEGGLLTADLLPDLLMGGGAETQAGGADGGLSFAGFSLKEAQKWLEKEMIGRALEETGGNKSKASMLLEISYPSLLSKIKEYSL